MIAIAVAALVATATPVKAPPVVTTPATPSTTVTVKDPLLDLKSMLAIFDRMFPAQADPDPARLALARVTVRQGLMPPGTFGKAMGGMMGSMVDRVLAMKPSDLDGLVPATKTAKGAKPAAASDKTLHQKLVEEDPHFDERMRLTRTAIEGELTRVSAIIEPRLQEGLARAVARRLDVAQLGDVNAFFATPSGRALGQNFLTLWIDPDLMRSMMAGLPEMIALAPGAIGRIEAATAHLPKPKPKPVDGTKAKPAKPRQ